MFWKEPEFGDGFYNGWIKPKALPKYLPWFSLYFTIFLQLEDYDLGGGRNSKGSFNFGSLEKKKRKNQEPRTVLSCLETQHALFQAIAASVSMLNNC